MALQLFKIADVTVSSPQTTVEFTSIPQGYTDLIVKASVRLSPAAVSQSLGMYVNSIAADCSYKTVRGDGATAGTVASSGQSDIYVGEACANSATANTFSNTEIYIPNYTGSNQKISSTDAVTEHNSTTAYTFIGAGLTTKTAAVTLLGFRIFGGGTSTIMSNSTFTLYGVL